MTRQIPDKIIGTLDENGFYTKNSVHSTLLKEEYENRLSLEYALAIMNWKLVNWLYSLESDEGGRVFPQVKIGRLRDLPFYLLSYNQLIRHTQLVPDVFTCELTKREEILNAINHEIYKLYGLNFDEVKIVDPETLITKEEYEE